jgi:hypothetical protein
VSTRRPYRRARSSKAIAGSLYAPLIEAIGLALTALVTALGRAVATVINAIRRRKPPQGELDV